MYIDLAKSQGKEESETACLNSPRFAWGGRPHRRVICISISKSFAAIRSPRKTPLLGSSQWVLFFIFSLTWGPPKLQKNCPNDILHRYLNFFHKILQSPCFLKCVCMFLQCVPSKHGNLHICHHKTVPKHNFFTMFQFPHFPEPLKTPLFTLFSSILPCSNAAGQLKHI